MAEAQHGVVARTQLVALGLSGRAIEGRLGAGRLHALHRGVYAVGHRGVSRRGRWLAAVLAGGCDAALSHRTAGALWEIRASAARQIDVTVPRALRQRPGLRFHRDRLADDEVVEEDGIPVCTPARTLFDLAAVLTRAELARSIERADALRLTSPHSLDDLIARHPRRPGVAELRAVLAATGFGAGVTRSELEDRFLSFLEQHGLLAPRVNAVVNVGGRTFEVDCLWEASRVIVELDGHFTHATPGAFERDRERDRLLQAAGWRVIRITWRQLHDDPARLARDIAALVEAGPPRPRRAAASRHRRAA